MATTPGRDKTPIKMGTLPNGETGGSALPMSNKSKEPGYNIGNSNDGVDLDTGYKPMGSARSGADDGMKHPPSSDQ